MDLWASSESRNKNINGRESLKAGCQLLVMGLGWLAVSFRASCVIGSQVTPNRMGEELNGASKSRIIVLVYLYTPVPPHIIGRAEDYAGYVLSKAGVETVWSDCGPSRASHQNPICEDDADSLTLRLRIVSEPVSFMPGTTEDTLGYSVGYIATIVYPKVQDLASRGDADIDDILGCSIAHEIGHVLLGQIGHSAYGIMKSRWTPADLQLARKRGLRFTPEQAERIHGRVLALMRE